MADKLISLFSEVLTVEASSLTDESSPDTVANWDSLGAMSLVTAIEEEFKVQLSTKDIMRMSSIGFARQTLHEKGINL